MTKEELTIKINTTLSKFDEFRDDDMENFTCEIMANIEIYMANFWEVRKKKIMIEYLNGVLAELK